MTMQFIKVGTQYINMAQVHQVETDQVDLDDLDVRLPIVTLYLYTSDHTIRITGDAERAAVLAWLDAQSSDVLHSDECP
jgi:hypothetical protein